MKYCWGDIAKMPRRVARRGCQEHTVFIPKRSKGKPMIGEYLRKAGAVATLVAGVLGAGMALANGKTKPVMDSHQHIFLPSRPGVVWPDSTNATLYKDYL